MPYNPVDPKPNLPELEQKMLGLWRSEKTFERSVSQREGAEQFILYQGPPTANGRPHIGHAITLAYKDILPRYKAMRGYFTPRIGGWDTHGLPVELEVEKELGIKSKPEIEQYGIAAFNAKCRESVWKYKEEWESFTDRIGYWIDQENAYVTYKNEYIESVWWVLKKLWDKGLLYQAHKVVPYCPRCGTSLSSHEVALGYKTVKDTSVYIKFKIVSDDPKWANTAILSWTTTPWTLPGNVALAINSKHEFVKVSDPSRDGSFLLLEKTCFSRLAETETFKHAKPVEVFQAAQIIGLSYQPLFDIKALKNENSHKVYQADFVTTDDGTGVVHTAVMYGEDDYKLGSELGLPQHHTVDAAGKFTEDVPALAGKFVKSKTTEEMILAYLKSHDQLLADELCEHEYPFCWRCETPLLYYAQTTWFINMQMVKDQLIANNQKINWLPTHLRDGRFGNFLTEIKDWALSRQRYWGTPLPIWICAKDKTHKTMIGSIKELTDKVTGTVPAELDLHRPMIDEVVLKCDKCDGMMKRIPDLIDVWFDSGAMPYAQWHYPFENTDTFAKRYPANYISEAIDQTRGWFYTLLAISTLLEHAETEDVDGPAYLNVVTLGLGLDESGKKMSKSKGNVIHPLEVMDSSGADALRLYLYSQTSPGETWRVSPGLITETSGRFLLTWWNTYSFFVTYARIDKLEASDLVALSPDKLSLRQVDQWILARLSETTDTVRSSMDSFDVRDSAKALMEFMDDLSNWYVRRNRRRFWKGGDLTDPDKLAAYWTLWHALTTYAKLSAPFTPFLSDHIFRELTGSLDSVHLSDYPALEPTADKSLTTQMRQVRTVVELGLAYRGKAKQKVRQPLRTAYIVGVEAFSEELDELIREELNVKSISYGNSTEGEAVETAGGISVWLDAVPDEELKVEGAARELTRAVQDQRKKSGLEVIDHIRLKLAKNSALDHLIEKFADEIKGEVLADELMVVDDLAGDALREVEVMPGVTAKFSIEKV